ncbi:MAG: hemerythrin domain-containing protein [Actinomycetota bacterium]|nr:hemerythrin domain-containing protein [Actinomycetota bacterium]
MARNVNALVLLSNDHRAAEELFGRLMNPKHVNRGVNRDDTIDRLILELSVHAEIEEELLYPAIRRNVDGGRRLAKEAEEDHQRVKDMLTKLAEMDPDSREAEALIAELHTEMEAHMAEEEGPDGLFDQLRASMDEESLQELASQITESKIAKTVKNPAPDDEDSGNPPPKEVGGRLFHMQP